MHNFVEQYGPWAVVTGASSGIGEEIARILAARGLNVAVVARRTERLEALAKALETSHDIETNVVTADLATTDGVERVAALADELEVGLLVNNAGISAPFRPLNGVPYETLETMSKLNMLAPARLIYDFLPGMQRRGRGGVINVASTASFQAMPYMANYGATKAYLLSLSDAVATEVAQAGIDVVALCPGPTDTEITDHVDVDRDSVAGILMPADKVALAGVDALGKKRVVVPGVSNAIGAQLAQRLVPRRLLGWALGYVMRKRFVGSREA